MSEERFFIRMKHHMKGYDQLRRDPALKAQMRRLGEGIANRAAQFGGIYAVRESEHKSRSHVSVGTYDWKAMHVNARDNSLLKSLK